MIPDFGLNIKLARIKAKIKQKDIAKIMGESGSTISFWESGKRQPTVKDIWRICNVLHISADKIIFG